MYLHTLILTSHTHHTHTHTHHRTTPREDEVITETLRRSTRAKKPRSRFKPTPYTPRPSKKKANRCPTPGSQSSGTSSDIPSSASAGLTHMLSQVLQQQREFHKQFLLSQVVKTQPPPNPQPGNPQPGNPKIPNPNHPNPKPPTCTSVKNNKRKRVEKRLRRKLKKNAKKT